MTPNEVYQTYVMGNLIFLDISSQLLQPNQQNSDSVDTISPLKEYSIIFADLNSNKSNNVIYSEQLKTALDKLLHNLNLYQNNQTIELTPTKPNEEMVNWITTSGKILIPLPRSIIHQYNLLHRGIGAIIINQETSQLFLHQRSSTKRVFPSMLDMLIGGVSSIQDEDSKITLLRELSEECGINLDQKNINFIDDHVNQQFLNEFKQELISVIKKEDKFLNNPAISTSKEQQAVQIEYLGETMIATSYNQCLVDMYFLYLPSSLASSISFPDGEIAWGRWISLQELKELLEEKEKEFVPDGMQVWYALPTMLHLS